ncbi:Mor transcription activator family protein [Burkholderia aenigmatica]|uniref:Mor transcription activator family protein n=1 Tax=Burkholderia aenigmatica TaxID=2015348 RepID=UPI0015C64BB7|nr:Mor transcription activator family protein [Burkholderia aenigmatica]
MKTVEDAIFAKEQVRPEVTRFERLSRFIGEYNANNLCDEVGGQDMIIPRSADQYTPFDRLFGKRLAKEVKAQFGGMVVYVPQQVGSGHTERNAEICLRRNSGWTIADLAQRFYLTERRIRQIINEGTSE